MASRAFHIKSTSPIRHNDKVLYSNLSRGQAATALQLPISRHDKEPPSPSFVTEGIDDIQKRPNALSPGNQQGKNYSPPYFQVPS